MLTLAKNHLTRAEFYEYSNIIFNNVYFLTLEHVILGLLTDNREEKRAMGRDFIIKAREDEPKIEEIFVIEANYSMNMVKYICYPKNLFYSDF